ncbi:MAG: cysteine--tRNA ligase [Calditrichaeota bacterium]|nr:MAG: cysteine--tRNA ligase [Calditrichota bacterium]MBL1206949.1 cysteine--tRNA ligase [Calditrichota bacterium]NOG46776.1 cysteine--tRNA ligase [Calditrichota bacterium]
MKLKENNLVIYNSLSRKKEKFQPINPGFVGIYVCGPTVYSDSHLGHAKSCISFDIVVRYFRYLGYKVRYVQNITDVGHLQSDADEGEDKIAEQARLERLEPMEVVENYTRSYFEDMDVLNVLRPDISPRASGHIPEQVEMIETLIKKGYAYEANGNVYYEVEKFKEYGKLSGRTVDEMKEGHRVEVQSEKRNAADFALWKKADPTHIMRWNSPWGKGYPGWHLECSCMSNKYLGETFDIHGGGMENKFPHHESEIAQSEAANGKPFVKYWMHNNMVNVDGVKMGKSLGNFTTLKKALQAYSPMAIRFFILTSHYGATLEFSDTALQAAEKGLQKIYSAMAKVFAIKPGLESPDENFDKEISLYEKSFREAMDDDFNSPRAIAATFDFVKKINPWLENDPSRISNPTHEKLVHTIEALFGDVLGLIPDSFEQDDTSSEKMEGVMQLLISLRAQLRAEKNFALADEIRNKLTELDITLKDSREGTTWE